MKGIVVGYGMMGKRHVAALQTKFPESNFYIIDKDARKQDKQCENKGCLGFKKDLEEISEANVDFVIVATSTQGRYELLKKVKKKKPKIVLIEKPIEQSYENCLKIEQSFEHTTIIVNLIRQVSDFYLDQKAVVQKYLEIGEVDINIIGGSCGIGANGIHYISLAMWLLNANRYKINYADIDDSLIPSGRGENYKDFGGLLLAELYDSNERRLGTINIRLSANSTAPYIILITGKHLRIQIDELNRYYYKTEKVSGFDLPINRYFSGYSNQIYEKLNFSLDDEVNNAGVLSIKNYLYGKTVRLPTITEVLPAHQLMFDWLERSSYYNKKFPIT